MAFHQNSISSGSDIRLCIFLISSVCVGLLALGWAFHQMHRHRGRISVFITILLFGDLIQLILNLWTVLELLLKLYWSSNMVQYWSGLHFYGFQLHQLVAIEGVLGLKYSQCSAYIFSLLCYILFLVLLVCSGVSTYTFGMDPFENAYISLFGLVISLVSLSLLVVTFMITCKPSSTPVSENKTSLLTVAIFNFVLLYSPFVLFISVNFIMGGVHMYWFKMCLCLMNLRVISDTILCVLVCRGNLRDVQMPQTHTEPNADEMSV